MVDSFVIKVFTSELPVFTSEVIKVFTIEFGLLKVN